MIYCFNIRKVSIFAVTTMDSVPCVITMNGAHLKLAVDLTSCQDMETTILHMKKTVLDITESWHIPNIILVLSYFFL